MADRRASILDRIKPMPAPLSYSVTGAAEAIGISRSTMWKLINEGALPAFKLGHRTLIHRDDLEEFIGRLAGRRDE